MNEAGPPPEPSDEQVPTPQGWGPVRYFREAIRIARFDAEAIARVSRDRWALFYGAGFLALGALIVTIPRSRFDQDALSTLNPGGQVFALVLTGVALALVVAFHLVFSIVQVAAVHGAAKLVFGATGTYVSLLRVLWLGSLVNVLVLVPFIGRVAAGIWFFLITLVTFEEVDGIERLQAFALAAIMGITTLIAMLVLG